MYSNELICNILKYINDNINSVVSIDLISSIFCYDKFYIMKKFKKEVGISIVNYINSIKIFNSLILYKSDYTILKIALDSGFNSLEYYSEMFKKIMKVNPRDYKKFISFRVDITEDDVSKITDSLLRLNELKNFVDSYIKKVKPTENPVIKLSLK